MQAFYKLFMDYFLVPVIYVSFYSMITFSRQHIITDLNILDEFLTLRCHYQSVTLETGEAEVQTIA